MTVPANIKMMMGIDNLIREALPAKVFFTDTMFVVVLEGKRRIECYLQAGKWDAMCYVTGEDHRAVPYRGNDTLIRAVNRGMEHWGENALSAS